MSAVYRTIGGANACGFQSRVKEAMDALRTFHSAANRVEWLLFFVGRIQKLGQKTLDIFHEAQVNSCDGSVRHFITNTLGRLWGL
ncbi:hypothetical protein TNCV_3586601 [Trichonephila clavipes]|nr:hypothetical protein TNCV_3586601 [Trichonephila clavipes]